MSAFVIIEPNLRGSRLQVVANLIDAIIRLNQSSRVFLVTREDYRTEHFEELISSRCSEVVVVPVTLNLGGAWIKTLNSQEVGAILNAVLNLQSKHADVTVIYAALDECMRALLLCWFRALKVGLRARSIFAVKYRIDYLMRWRSSIRAFALTCATNVALLVTRARLITFDERLAKGQSRCQILPDPWFGEFGSVDKMRARELLNVPKDRFVVLSIGRQDRRKGFDTVMRIMRANVDSDSWLHLVVGRVDDAYKAEFDLLKGQMATVHHVNEFVDEAQLPLYFAAADVCLLPYAADFNATSGVLPRAAAAGVPVVASRHGLVGFRVREFGLGATAEAGDEAEFRQAIDAIKDDLADGQSRYRLGLDEFARKTSLDAFFSRVAEILK